MKLADFDAVAFDVEGTLADSIPVHHKARLAAFKEHGFGYITPEQHALGPTYGSTSPDIIGGVLAAAGAITPSGLFKDHPGVQRVLATKQQEFEKLAVGGFGQMPGAIRFFKEMMRRFPGKVALVTTADSKFVWPFLDRYGITQIASELVIAEDTVRSLGLRNKPAPDAYGLAMERLKAKRLLVFEDVISGVAAAKSAGATVIMMGFDQPNVARLAQGGLEYLPDAVVANYDEARKLLGLSA